MNIRPVLLPILLAGLAARAACPGALSESASYCLQQATLNGGGTLSTSASYRLTGSLAQESVIGVSASPNYVLQSGFWSYYGSGLVPVLLTVHKNGSNPANPDLGWTGNNAPYSVYRVASACSTIFSNFLTSQIPLTYTDTTPPASALVCYNVLATAPGPVPPPSDEPGMMSPGTAGTLDPVVKPQ